MRNNEMFALWKVGVWKIRLPDGAPLVYAGRDPATCLLILYTCFPTTFYVEAFEWQSPSNVDREGAVHPAYGKRIRLHSRVKRSLDPMV